MALYSQLLTKTQNIQIQSYAIASLSQLGFFTQAHLLQQSSLVDRTRFLHSFQHNFSFAFALSLCRSKLPAKNQPSLKQSPCTNQPAVLYL